MILFNMATTAYYALQRLQFMFYKNFCTRIKIIRQVNEKPDLL